MATAVDLDPETRRALEFDELLEWVASRAATSQGAQRVRELRPLADVDAVREELSTVAEARSWVAQHGALVPAGLPDGRAASEALELAGIALEVGPLRELATVLGAGASLCRQLARLDVGRWPRLDRARVGLVDLGSVARPILDGTEPDGRLRDTASKALRDLRARRARVGQRLQQMLARIVKGPEARDVIRDDFVTQRNGRFVVPVRTDSPRPVRGIVHASSSSGATQFVEPLQSVELNNERVQLRDLEREEEARVLARWTDGLRSRSSEVETTLEALTRLDALQARARFAEELHAVTPEMGEGGALRLSGARHPLLERRLGERGERPVPMSIAVDPADQVLVLSGPNAGGKTVALKTFGLTLLMAQSGIPVACDTAELPVFRQVRADIGDHQSIDADLSTFSAHLRAVGEFISGACPPCLVLFDEIGTGTEPGEGAALAQAVLERLQRPGITTVATTHHGALKAWAFSREGCASAALEHDPETLRPTYRVLAGRAGISAGLSIASRLGLADSVVERASSLLSPDARQGEAYLRRLQQMTAELEERVARQRAREQELEQERDHTQLELQREGERRAREAEAALARALREFERRTQRELQRVQDARERERLSREVTRAGRRVAQEHERQRRAVTAGRREPDADAGAWQSPTRSLCSGDRVRVRSLGRVGELIDLGAEQAQVRLGTMTIRVDLREIQVPVDEAATPKAPAARQPPPRPLAKVEDTGEATSELVLVGQRVDEALARLDKFLDDSMLEGRSSVRVVHGHGTGRLRAAIREHLRDHSHVRSYRSGSTDHEGGNAATIVTLT